MKFFYVQYVYMIIALVAGVTALFNTELYIALSGIIAPFIAWWGGSGMRGSFYGDNKQKIVGIISGIIFLAISLYWINYTNYWVYLFDVGIPGTLWIIIGFLIGLIFTTKKHSLNIFD